MCVCVSDLIPELYGQSVRIVDRQVVWLEGHCDVLAISWSNAALCWRHTEHTQPTVVLGSCTGCKRQKVPSVSVVNNETQLTFINACDV